MPDFEVPHFTSRISPLPLWTLDEPESYRVPSSALQQQSHGVNYTSAAPSSKLATKHPSHQRYQAHISTTKQSFQTYKLQAKTSGFVPQQSEIYSVSPPSKLATKQSSQPYISDRQPPKPSSFVPQQSEIYRASPPSKLATKQSSQPYTTAPISCVNTQHKTEMISSSPPSKVATKARSVQVDPFKVEKNYPIGNIYRGVNLTSQSATPQKPQPPQPTVKPKGKTKFATFFLDSFFVSLLLLYTPII
jgi:hypothetical protein